MRAGDLFLMKNATQLITYVDRLSGGGVADLQRLLEGPLRDLFGAVHLLPFFYPIDGADAGFDPIDHTQVDTRLGTWADIRKLTQTTPVMADIIVNHISSSSPHFLDVVKRGAASPHADLFLTFSEVFPLGATEQELLALHSTRPSLPFTIVPLGDGTKRLFWTSFTPQQIDIDIHSASGRAYLEGILETFAAAGISLVRLDAGGYAVKKGGTSCFMLPETLAFISTFTEKARAKGIEILVEMHGHYEQQLSLAPKIDRVYDFALPPLILHTLYTQDTDPLQRWLKIAPRNAFTVLDTHDGIGVADVDCDAKGTPGLLSSDHVRALVAEIHRRSGGTSLLASGAAASNIDELQVNCTFFDALGADDNLYLMARALQFFAPGIPQVYYVGLLAGRNDVALLERTGVGRDINRHHYTREEIERDLERPVVRRLLELIRFRNLHPAFNGHLEVPSTGTGRIILRWVAGKHVAELNVDLKAQSCEIVASDAEGTRTFSVLAAPH